MLHSIKAPKLLIGSRRAATDAFALPTPELLETLLRFHAWNSGLPAFEMLDGTIRSMPDHLVETTLWWLQHLCDCAVVAQSSEKPGEKPQPSAVRMDLRLIRLLLDAVKYTQVVRT